MRDTKKYAIPGCARYQEVRDARKYGIRKHKIPDTRSQEVRNTRKYKIPIDTKTHEIPGLAKYTRIYDIP